MKNEEETNYFTDQSMNVEQMLDNYSFLTFQLFVAHQAGPVLGNGLGISIP